MEQPNKTVCFTLLRFVVLTPRNSGRTNKARIFSRDGTAGSSAPEKAAGSAYHCSEAVEGVGQSTLDKRAKVYNGGYSLVYHPANCLQMSAQLKAH